MTLWPFNRKKRREGAYSSISILSPNHQEKSFDERHIAPIYPQQKSPQNLTSLQTTPAGVAAPPSTQSSPLSPESQRKRRRSPELPLESLFAKDVLSTAQQTSVPPQLREHHGENAPDSYVSHAQYAAPSSSAQNYVPHLERVRASRKPPTRTAPAPRRKRLSKRQEIMDRAIREEQVRAMSAQGSHSKRSSAHGGDLTRPDSNKANRVFGHSRSAKRDSAASVGPQGSICSSMSAASEHNGWEISALDFLNPRPRFRYSAFVTQSTSMPTGLGLQRSASNSERLPVVNEQMKKINRNKISHLADDLDASDIRLLMERDRKRREKKRLTDFDDLDKSLSRIRTENERAERAAELARRSTIHPAFRSEQSAKDTAETFGQAPLSPVSIKNDRPDSSDILVPAHGHYQDDSLKDQPAELDAGPTSRRQSSTPEVVAPSAALGDELVVGTAEEFGLSQAQMSHGNISPPQSPYRNVTTEKPSPLRRELSGNGASTQPPLVAAEGDRRSTNTGSKKNEGWAHFFRRGGASSSKTTPLPTPDTSFSNTSRESMLRQPLPPSLLATASTKRNSGTAPTRKQSIFREELSDLSILQVPSAKAPIRSSDAALLAANVALINKQSSAATGKPELGLDAEKEHVRTESPVDVAMTSSLASIDSEGSWLHSKHSIRKSVQSGLRSSVGSLPKAANNGSSEDLGIPEEPVATQSGPKPDEIDRASTPGELPGQADMDYGPVKRRETNRKTPTLVHRDPQHKSREGLVADYLSSDPMTPMTELMRPATATSNRSSEGGADSPTDPGLMIGEQVEYGKGHVRQMSTGSGKARLLDIRNRSSTQTSPETSPEMPQISTRAGFTRPKSEIT